MDALALLCNLHGDGPVTLAALRDVGCEDLIGLEALGDSLLCELLGRDERGVSRFRREARLLTERLDDSQGNAHGADEESPEELPTALVLEPKAPPRGELAASVAMGKLADAAPSDKGSGTVVGAVLDLWRRLDDEAESEPTSDILQEVSLSGLSHGDVLALDQAGVRTLTELAEADPMVLTQRSGLSYTHLAHLAFLARKSTRRKGAPKAEEHSESVSLGEQQAEDDRGSRDGAAGPFA